MEFIVQDEVKALGIKILGVKIEGIDNETSNKDFDVWRNSKVNELISKYENYEIRTDKVIEGFYKIHDKVKVPRRKNLPASENLIKTLVKKGELVHINKAVDIYNIISIESKLCLGAHDINKISGNVYLKITDGTEKFIPLGSNEEKPVGISEYSFVDGDNDVICWLDIRQVDKTKVTEKTHDVIYFIIGNEENTYDELEYVARKIIDATTKFCGGKGIILR